jgi:L-ascorbate metabolism protein UlaG (beta-lactamase superfamily)
MTPPHHVPGGGFRNPWPGDHQHQFRDFLRWRRERRAAPPAPRPAAPPATVPSNFDTPHAPADALTATWIGHASTLLQIGRLNVLTDPMWSRRASPVSWAGPSRLVAPPVDLRALPPVDLILLSHNHYDHLDRGTVHRLARLHPGAIWFAPLGVARLLRGWGAGDVRELDWWDSDSGTVSGATVTCTPARHFSGRTPWDRAQTLWAGWTIAADGWRVFFAGDTAYHPEFRAIAEWSGPFDLALLPIGAYEPRWFMGSVHMNPEDAVLAYGDLCAAHEAPGPAMLPIHWGTFRLTDEPIGEPPARIRTAWAAAGLAPGDLWLPAHGETQRRVRRG